MIEPDRIGDASTKVTRGMRSGDDCAVLLARLHLEHSFIVVVVLPLLPLFVILAAAALADHLEEAVVANLEVVVDTPVLEGRAVGADPPASGSPTTNPRPSAAPPGAGTSVRTVPHVPIEHVPPV